MVIHPSYYDACDVSCDVIYYVIAVRARRMVRIFFLPYLGNRSKSDPCSYELFCLKLHILSFPNVLQIPPESPCILCSKTFFKIVLLWDNVQNDVEPVRPQMTIGRMHIAWWMPKAINTHSEHVIFIAFPLQQRLRDNFYGDNFYAVSDNF